MKEHEVVQICSALGHPERMRIILMLQKGARSVSDMLTEMNIKQSTLSHHLKILRKAGFIRGERIDRYTYYYANKEAFDRLEIIIQEIKGLLPDDPLKELL